MIEALLDGFRESDTRAESIDLSEREIGHCRACHDCWFRTPGRCVMDDDMTQILEKMRGSDILIFGSPVHFCNISSRLKTFFDRMTAAGGDPHKAGEDRAGKTAPGYIMVANSGFPSRDQFDVISLWIQRVARMSKSVLMAEFYAPGGKALVTPSADQIPSRDQYREYLRDCAREIAQRGSLNEEQRKRLGKDPLGH